MGAIKDIRRFYRNALPRPVQLYFWVVLFHMARKTIFNSENAIGHAEISGGSVLLLFCLMLNLCIIVIERKYASRALKKSYMFFFYGVFALCSVLWSPYYGAAKFIIPKALELILSSVVIAITLYKIPKKEIAMLYVFYLTTAAALMGYVSYAINSGSLFPHTNTYSLLGAMGTVMGICMRKKYKSKSFKWIVGLNMWMMVVGTSSATYLSFIAAMIVFYSMSRWKLNPMKMGITLLIVFIVYNYATEFVYQYVFYGKSAKAIETNTGRDAIWDACFLSYQDAPWLGQGYIISERSLVNYGLDLLALSAHNGYLSVLVNTGIVGCMILGLYLLFTIKTAYFGIGNRMYNVEMKALFVALVCVCVNNMAFPAFGSDWNFTFPPIIATFVLINTLRYKL